MAVVRNGHLHPMELGFDRREHDAWRRRGRRSDLRGDGFAGAAHVVSEGDVRVRARDLRPRRARPADDGEQNGRTERAAKSADPHSSKRDTSFSDAR